MMIRRYTFKLYPSKAAADVLTEHARMCASLWNAALEMQEAKYRRERKHIHKFALSKQIKDLRVECPEWKDLHSCVPAKVIEALDQAFQHFFRRMKEFSNPQTYANEAARFMERKGRRPTRYELAGYPKYKRVLDGDSIPLRDSKAGGWWLRKRSGSAWTFRLKGVGEIKARGKFPIEPDDLKNATIMRRNGCWWLSVAVSLERERAHGEKELQVDLNLIDEFASVKDANGQSVPGLCNPFLTGRNSEIVQHSMGLQGSLGGTPGNEGNAEGRCARRCSETLGGTPGNEGNAEVLWACVFDAGLGGTPGNEGNAESGIGCGLPTLGGTHGNEGNAEGVGHFRAKSLLGGTPGNEGNAEARSDDLMRERDIRFRGPWKDVDGKRIRQAPSYRWKQWTRLIARQKAREARRRNYMLHKWSSDIVAAASGLTVTKPPMKQAIQSGRGHEKNHGAQVQTVALLNRSVLEQAPGLAVQMIEYKAAESGIRCDVVTRDEHEITVGTDLKRAAVATRRTRRIIRKKAGE